MVYYTDRLQFAGHEEGRTRFIPIAGATPAKLVYDYFLKDHLGNVRMVLTDDQQTDAYPAATMETATAAAEETYYTNLPATRVPRPALFPVATGQAMVAKVGSGVGSSKIGPAIILKVMAGDKVNLQANSWWNAAATPGTAVSPLNDLILAMATAIAPVSAGKALATELQAATVLSPNITSFLGSQSNIAGRPKAYINWILLDEQFKYVSTGSGFEQVDNNGVLKTHTRTNLPVTASGYLYIYVSNETPNIDVFFDNLQVSHVRGPLVEETHYYPFGMQMQGISSKALSFGNPTNKFKYNGIELTTDLELNLYDAEYRELDPQTARWWQIDPVTDGYEQYSPYASMYDNPIRISDPLGNEGETCCKDFLDGVDNALITASGLMNGMLNTASGGLVSTDPFNFRSKLSSEKQSLYDASVQVGQIGPLVATVGRSSFGEVPALQTVNGPSIPATLTLRPAIVPTSSDQSSASSSGKRRENRLPDKGEPNSTQSNKPGTTIKKYGPDGNVQKEFNKGHIGKGTPKNEKNDHIHDYKPNPKNPSGSGEKRYPGRPPKKNELKKDFGL